jgi:cytochrome c553
MRRPIIIIGGLITMAAISHFTFRFALGQERPPVGNAQAGARIAEDGTSAGAPACVSCHGVDGNPDGSGTFPRLFGLPKDYLFKQLGDYAGGRRSNDLMSSIAKSLTAQEAANVSAYYATAKEPLPKFPVADKGLVILGEKLAAVGDQTKQVPACNNCHGPSGAGQSPVIPGLAGQFAPYIFQQLSDWQNGTRKNDGGAQMSTIVKRLSAQDLSAAAAYYQQVPDAGAPARSPSTQ